MASLTNTKIKDTYDGLLKTTDNDALGGTYKLITDGLGNSSGVYLGTGGRLGIGASPTETLDVRGSVKIGKSGTSPYLTFDEEPDSGSGSEFYLTHDISGNILKFTDDNSNDLIAMDRDTGFIGIGLTSPADPFHLAMTNGDIRIDAETDRNHILSRNAGNSDWRDICISASSGQDQFVLDTNGKVGIGATSIDGNSTLQVQNDSGNSLIRVRGGSSNIAGIDFGDSGDIDIAGIRYYNSTNYMQFNVNASERMRIDSSGNVGIGQSTASYQLDLGGGTTNRQRLRLRRGSDDNNQDAILGYDTLDLRRTSVPIASPQTQYTIKQTGSDGSRDVFKIDSSGNVGIGTSSPSTYLTVQTSGSTGSDDIAIFSRSTGEVLKISREAGEAVLNANSNLTLSADYDNNNTSTGSNLIFKADASERMRIDSSGNVLIGTSSSARGKVDIDMGGSAGAAINFDYGGAGGWNQYRYNGGTIAYIGQGAGLLSPSGSTTDFVIRSQDELAFATGGSTERLRIDSSGNVGINISNPSSYNFNDPAYLVVGSVTGNSTLSIVSSNSAIGYLAFADGTSGTDRYIGQLRYNHSTNAMSMHTSGSERMRITSGGDVLFGTTATPSGSVGGSGFLSVSNNRRLLRMASTSTASNTLIDFYNPNGGVGGIVISGTSTSYSTSSDYRLKENVIDMTGALDRVDQLEPKRFNFIADEDTTVDGFLAHEVQDIVPEAVTGEKDAVDAEGNPQYQGIDQSKIVPLLVGAIKELKAEIETLKSQINS